MPQLLLVFSFALWANFGQALSRPEPPKYRVIDVATKNQFIRVDNTRKLIEVRAADTFGLLWAIKLRRFYTWDYEIYLSLDGKYLFYFLPATSVRNLESSVLEVYSRDGFITEYRVGEFLDSLPAIDTPCAGCPTHYWRGGSRHIYSYDEHIFVDLIDGRHVQFWASEHKVLVGSYERTPNKSNARKVRKSPRH